MNNYLLAAGSALGMFLILTGRPRFYVRQARRGELVNFTISTHTVIGGAIFYTVFVILATRVFEL